MIMPRPRNTRIVAIFSHASSHASSQFSPRFRRCHTTPTGRPTAVVTRRLRRTGITEEGKVAERKDVYEVRDADM